MRHLFFPSALLFLTLVFVHAVQAQVMQSSNYQLQSDSINIGGGYSTSTNYIQESTVGEVGTGPTDSTNYSLRAGYQQMQEVFLSLSGGAHVSMTPNIPGVTGGESNGSTTLTAVTDSPAGYQLTIESTASPSMVDGGNSIADYTPSGTTSPTYSFTTSPADSHFGYSPTGVDIVDRFKNNGTYCETGSNVTALQCWDGLSMTSEVIAQSSGPNQPDGATTTIYYKVGVGSSVLQAPGTYIATTTVTLLAL